MKEKIDQLNNTIFTENGIPLPVEEDEDILYYNENTKLTFQAGNGIPSNTRKYVSYSGSIFITNYRLVYRPERASEAFSSFGIPLFKLLYVDNEHSLDFVINSNYIATIYISFDDSDSTVFFNLIRNIINNSKYEPDIIDEPEIGNNEDPPYYSDVCE